MAMATTKGQEGTCATHGQTSLLPFRRCGLDLYFLPVGVHIHSPSLPCQEVVDLPFIATTGILKKRHYPGFLPGAWGRKALTSGCHGSEADACWGGVTLILASQSRAEALTRAGSLSPGEAARGRVGDKRTFAPCTQEAKSSVLVVMGIPPLLQALLSSFESPGSGGDELVVSVWGVGVVV